VGEFLANDLADPLSRHTEVFREPRLQAPTSAVPGHSTLDEDARRDPQLLGPRQLVLFFVLL
jgi:hypothetical protein